MLGSRPRARSAFPTKVPSYLGVHKSVLENKIQSKRERESDNRLEWQGFTKYISKADVKSSYDERWSRPNSAIPKRITPFEARMIRTKNEILARKAKLACLLREEESSYKKEMDDYLEEQSKSKISSIHERVEQLKKEKMTARLNSASDKRMQMWRRDNPRVRSAEVERRRQDMIDVWSGQLEEKEEEQREREAERRMRAEEAERDRQLAELERKQAEEEKNKKQAEFKEQLAQQVRDLQQREAEQNKLKNEERALLSNAARHDQVMLEKQLAEKRTQQQQMRKLLFRQYRAQLLRRAHEVERDLQMDLALLERVKAEEEEERHLEENKKENQRALALEGIALLKQKLKEEKETQEQIDNLYRDQASDWWEKKEQVWAKENAARQKLLDEILVHRKSQIDEKLARNRAHQLEVMNERENLITALETARLQESAEAQETQRKRDDLVQGFKEQLHLRDEQIRKEIDEQEKENLERIKTQREEAELEEREINRVFAERRRPSTVRFAWD